jgi:hypothetical protein
MHNNTLTVLENIPYVKVLIKILINVGLISAFISIFYFTYVVTEEEHIVKNQVDILSINVVDSIKPFLTDKMKNFIIENLKKPNLSKEDEDIVISNQALTKSAIINISIICIMTVIISYTLAKYYDYDYINLLQNNLILLIFVAITEYAFIHLVPAKYITSDPNFIRYKIGENMKRKIKIVP